MEPFVFGLEIFGLCDVQPKSKTSKAILPELSSNVGPACVTLADVIDKYGMISPESIVFITSMKSSRDRAKPWCTLVEMRNCLEMPTDGSDRMICD